MCCCWRGRGGCGGGVRSGRLEHPKLDAHMKDQSCGSPAQQGGPGGAAAPGGPPARAPPRSPENSRYSGVGTDYGTPTTSTQMYPLLSDDRLSAPTPNRPPPTRRRGVRCDEPTRVVKAACAERNGVWTHPYPEGGVATDPISVDTRSVALADLGGLNALHAVPGGRGRVGGGRSALPSPGATNGLLDENS